jgi:hypothetical protein
MARRSFPEKSEVIKRHVKAGWVVTDQALDQADWTPDKIEAHGKALLSRAKGAMQSHVL